MSRSRAFNRSSRFNAKKKRSSLRSELPGLKDSSRKVAQPVDRLEGLVEKTTEREALAELIEAQMII